MDCPNSTVGFDAVETGASEENEVHLKFSGTNLRENPKENLIYGTKRT